MDLTNEEMIAGAAIAGGMAGAVIMMTVISLIVWYVLQVIAWWKIFKKMGEPGWKSIVPFYNSYIQGVHTWTGPMALLTYIIMIVGYAVYSAGLPASYDIYSSEVPPASPLIIIGGILCLVGLVLFIICQHKLSKSFGHGAGFTVGLVLLEPIFMLILGFGSSQYLGNKHTEGKSA